jgi:hypothetical protein
VDALGDVLAARLEQQHSEQLTTRKKVTKPPNEAMYHTSDHGSTTRLFSERKGIEIECQFKFPNSGTRHQGNSVSVLLQGNITVLSSRLLSIA